MLIADIGMPVEDGYGLIKKVRALPKERGGQTPALALTAYARTEDRVRALPKVTRCISRSLSIGLSWLRSSRI